MQTDFIYPPEDEDRSRESLSLALEDAAANGRLEEVQIRHTPTLTITFTLVFTLTVA